MKQATPRAPIGANGNRGKAVTGSTYRGGTGRVCTRREGFVAVLSSGVPRSRNSMPDRRHFRAGLRCGILGMTTLADARARNPFPTASVHRHRREL
jgi:hypothetical protein